MPVEKQMLEHLSNAFIESPFNKLLGLHVDQLTNEDTILSINWKKDLVGNEIQGILHGGVISSVLDMAGGLVIMANALDKHDANDINTALAIIAKCSTIDLHLSFLRPGRGEKFVAKAWLQKSGNKIAFARMELYNDKEELIATGSGTYMQG